MAGEKDARGPGTANCPHCGLLVNLEDIDGEVTALDREPTLATKDGPPLYHVRFGSLAEDRTFERVERPGLQGYALHEDTCTRR